MLHRLVPQQSNAPFSVPPVAFICALIGAPLVVAFFGFFILLVPVFALYFGGPFYLIFAGPTFYWYLKRRVPNMLEITLLALALNTCVFVLLLVLASLKPNIFKVTDILVPMAVLAVSCPLFGAQHFARSIALSANVSSPKLVFIFPKNSRRRHLHILKICSSSAGSARTTLYQLKDA